MQVSWTSAPAVEALCREALAAQRNPIPCLAIVKVTAVAAQEGTSCCFAIQALANIFEDGARKRFSASESVQGEVSQAKGDVQAALQQFEQLTEVDRIRAKYWQWRVADLWPVAHSSA